MDKSFFQPKYILGIATFVFIVVLGLQLFWLINNYSITKEQFLKQAENILKAGMLNAERRGIYTYLDHNPNNMQKDTLELLKECLNACNKIMPDSAALCDETCSIITSENSTQLDTELTHEIEKIDITFKTALQSLGYNYPYTLSSNNKDIENNSENNATNEAYIEYISQVAPQISLKATFPNLIQFILTKMIGNILLSALCILAALSTFWLLYKNIQYQQNFLIIKNDFTQNITHELKTPIATISTAVEALNKYDVLDDRETAKEYLHIMESEIERLNTMIENILLFAKVETTEMKMNFQIIDLSSVVRDVIRNFKSRTHQGSHIDIDSLQENLFIKGEKWHITNVVNNLLDNAIKYCNSSPKIVISGNIINNLVTLKVKDNGIGIPEKYKNHIFEKYFRVPTNDFNKVKGFGLGLSYVKSIITAHHGEINLESTQNQGTTFTIQLPLNNGKN